MSAEANLNGTGSVQVGAQSPEPLRVALEKLATAVQVVDAYGDDVPRQSFWDLFGAASAVLAAYPAEPAGVSDEAVEAAAQAYWDTRFAGARFGVTNEAIEGMRAALEAAQPFMQPQVVGTGVDSTLNTCPGCGVKVIGHERCGDPTRPGCAS